MSNFDYEQLCPGIRNAVRWFHQGSWETTDSGDGSLYKEGVEGSFSEPMVAVSVRDPRHLFTDSCSLYEGLEKSMSDEDFEKIDVQAMYQPRNSVSCILVIGEGLLKLNCKAELLDISP